MNEKEKREKLSIVVPCFNEEGCLENFFRVLKEVCNSNSERFGVVIEYIFVNDGSTDNTEEILEEFSRKENNVIVCEFARNFGKEAALSAGLKLATGDYVIPIDADLQHPPEAIFKMLELMKKNSDVDVVVAKRRSRENESFVYRFCTTTFYGLINKISNFEIPRDVGDFRLMRKKVVQALVNMPKSVDL